MPRSDGKESEKSMTTIKTTNKMATMMTTNLTKTLTFTNVKEKTQLTIEIVGKGNAVLNIKV